jgi:hypothetical protein
MENRQLAELRGRTRDRLDSLLMDELKTTGIGRSSFICAAIDFVKDMDLEELGDFIAAAREHEARLRKESPDSSDFFRPKV